MLSDQANRKQEYSDRGADINPDDIDTITILKSLESTAYYDIEAGNVAIVIKTKKAKKRFRLHTLY